MKIKFLSAVLATMALMLASCDDSKSYAELLDDENFYVNNFLADNKVILDIPEDTIFQIGADAPYYRIDEEGRLYMQVLNAGTEGNMVTDDEQIYFRYTRWPLALYNGTLSTGTGNNTSLSAISFRYNNFQIPSSYQWGVGIQRPLAFLPIDCEVNLIVKSTLGPVDESADVQPYLYRLTYARPAN